MRFDLTLLVRPPIGQALAFDASRRDFSAATSILKVSPVTMVATAAGL
jgi:hypothetical protein